MDHYDNEKRKQSYESSAMVAFFAVIGFLITLFTMLVVSFLCVMFKN